MADFDGRLVTSDDVLLFQGTRTADVADRQGHLFESDLLAGTRTADVADRQGHLLVVEDD